MRRQSFVVQIVVCLGPGALLYWGFADGCSLTALLLVSGQVGTERGGVLELFAAQLHQETEAAQSEHFPNTMSS